MRTDFRKGAYEPWMKRYGVLLDGVGVPDCFYADDEAGKVMVYRVSEGGIRSLDNPVTLTGEVRFVLLDEYYRITKESGVRPRIRIEEEP
jgi:hypothetical protein